MTAADIGDVLDDIDELTAAGQLFAPDAYADHAFDFKNAPTLSRRSACTSPIPAT